MLLALVTALIVARPLVFGEDPGLMANLADPWGMVLTLLWLLAAVGWASWRYWLRPAGLSRTSEGAADTPHTGDGGPDATANPQNWYGGWVQTSLLATVALVFLSAELAADYKFPARLIAWEWVGLFVAFLVVRQLAVTPREQHGLFAVFLAGIVAFSAQGIYQEFVELPRDRRLAEDLDEFRKVWADENPGQEISENSLEQLRLRAMEQNIFGPYAHPNSYAGFLVLGLPGLLGATVVSRRVLAPQWQTLLTAASALLGLAALWLTHSRGALLGLIVSGVGVGLFVYWRFVRAHFMAALIGFVVLIGVFYGVWQSGLLTKGMGKKANPIAQRLEYWGTTWAMIWERPWLGVGPGNFGENYPRLMPASSEEKIKDPHNFALEMWATCGVFAMLAILATLATFFYQVVRWLGGWVVDDAPAQHRNHLTTQQPNHLTTQSSNNLTTQPPDLRWEYYLGGMIGLVLGFALRVNTASPNNIMAETYVAGLRSVVWFAAFALLERLEWSDRGRLLALTTGIAALLLNLCVSGGIGFPSVAGPLWVAIALALNAVSLRPAAWLSRAGAAMILPVPILLGLFLGYGVYILYPILASDGLVREAVQTVAYFQSERSKPLSEQSAGVRDHPKDFIQKGVADRLNQAARLTPDDARIYVQLAWWTNVIWQLSPQKSSGELAIAKNALGNGVTATKLDPRGGAGYSVQYQIRVNYAEICQASAESLRKAHRDPVLINAREHSAREQYKLAAQALETYLPNDPHDAALHFALWSAWSKGGDKKKAREHAEEALELDDLVTMPARKLTESRRKQLDEWLKSVPAG